MGADGGATSVAVMADAQLTNVRVLKPFDNFESVYQGKSAASPIAFPGTRDKRAEESAPGFDPNLERGIPVPQGARVLLWFPVCFTNEQQLNPFVQYSYRLVWRFQNLAGYRNPAALTKRAPYHFPRQSPGANDTRAGLPGLPRVTVPASWHVVAFSQPEPTLGSAYINVRVEAITPVIDLTEFIPPLLPDGKTGIIQQGVGDPQTLPGSVMPVFMPFWTDAEGDELIILARRTVISGGDPPDLWDFTDPAKDLAFSNVYGTGNGAHPSFRDLGIYMQTGTTP